MNIDYVPKSTWKRIMMQLCFVVIILIVCSPYPSTASHDPWGENLQPKLHTDYLNEYSGKNNITAIIFNDWYVHIIFSKVSDFWVNWSFSFIDKTGILQQWDIIVFHAWSSLKQQQNISPNYSNKTIWHLNNFFVDKKVYYHKRDETWLSIMFLCLFFSMYGCNILNWIIIVFCCPRLKCFIFHLNVVTCKHFSLSCGLSTMLNISKVAWICASEIGE